MYIKQYLQRGLSVPGMPASLNRVFVCITDEYVGASAGVKALWDIVKFQ